MRNYEKRFVLSLTILAVALVAATGAGEAQTTSLIFADGFESGDTAAWSRARGPLAVNGDAAMDGSVYGLEVPGGSRSEVRSENADREKRIYVRFLFDPNDFQTPPARQVEILRFYAQGGRHHLRLVLGRNAAGEHRIALLVRGNRGGYNFIGGGRVMSESENLVEVAWSAATSRNGTDGSAALYLNDVLEANEPTLANGRLYVEAIQIGLLGGSVGATGGSYYLDDFASFRTLAP